MASSYNKGSYLSHRFGWTLTPVVKRIILANVAVYVLILVLNQIGGGSFGQNFIDRWFAFQPTRILLRPWGVFTYMFVHGGFWHITMNMIVLFFFGPPLEEEWGGREFFKYYVICGLGGVALSYVFLPDAIIGASAAIFGLMLAFAMLWPNMDIYLWMVFPIKAKWLVGALFLLTLFSAITEPGAGIAYLAHLGGIVTGLLYLKSGWRAAHGIERLKSKATGGHQHLAIVPHARRDRHEAESRTESQSRPPEGDAALYDAVDEVLDKISAHGMASLTPDERKLLDDVSRRHRTN